MERKKFIRKVCLLGDGGVGKTSLVRRFVEDSFRDEYIVSFGTKVSKKMLELGDVELTLMLWDILGQKGDDALHSAYYKGANGALLVCDVTRVQTIEHLEKWKENLLRAAPGAKVVLVANKADLGLKVTREELQSIADKLGGRMVMTSAKTGDGVEAAFLELGKAVMEVGK
ncbi:MAG TPA: Rab family GTPase [Methanomassiliicoccales archaeon]|nr:Rab family GTPase [Methanomassiliicoccales archaeon]